MAWGEGVDLQLPRSSHHEVKIGIIVDRCAHTTVVIEEFLLCDLGEQQKERMGLNRYYKQQIGMRLNKYDL